MKRKIVILFLLFLFPIFVSAVEVNTRTRDNLLIPDDLKVEESEIEDILKTPSVLAEEKIYDFADLLSISEEKKIYQAIADYKKKTKLDCVIVTTNDLKGFSISQYAYHFYDYNDFSNHGVIFVIYIHDNQKDIFMGNNGAKDSLVFTTYTDARIHDILKYVYKDIKSDEYYQACVDYIELISRFYEVSNGSFYHVDENGEVVFRLPILELLILSVSLTFCITFFIYKLVSQKEINPHTKKIDSNTIIIQVLSDEMM